MSLRIFLISLPLFAGLAGCRGREATPTEGAPATVASAAPPSVLAPATLPPMSADPAAANTACADCHPDEAASYASTGMGRSLSPVAGAAAIEDYTKAEITHMGSGFSYKAVRDADGRMWQEERLVGDAHWVRRIEAKYIIGSGNHTRSYLGEVDGQLVQLPLTWYSTRKLWDLSPGYEQANQPRFGRLVEAECLFCHNGLTPLKANTVAAYPPLAHGIGCDRCHGDGAVHVAERQAGKGPAAGQQDPSIFNPGRETPDRQLQVCQQCHLQADASVVHAGHRWDRYDPRLPLDRYLSVFRRTGQDGAAFTIASHGRRLALSTCAQQSADKLGCTTCHNPHANPTPESHRAACLGCHSEGAKAKCPDPAAAEGTCHRCHMAAGETADVPHVNFTDHFIRRRPGSDGRAEADVKTTALEDMVLGAAPLDGLDARLRMGLAHTFLWERQHLAEHLPEAISVLQAVLKEAPPQMAGLATGYAALGRALARQEKHTEAVAAFEEARKRDIDDPRFPEDLSTSLMALGRIDEARAVLQAAITRHPTPDRWMRLGILHLRAGVAPAAQAALEAAAGLTTADPAADTELAALALRAGDRATARTRLEAALARDFSYVPALLRMGLLEIQDGRFQEALRPLDRLLAREPKAGPAWLLRAQAKEKLGDVDGALADYGQVIEVAPEHAEPIIAAAELCLKHGRKQEAMALLTLGAGRFPKHPKVLELLGGLEF